MGIAQFFRTVSGIVFITAFGAFVILGLSWYTDKRKCEAELPRNVHCVWAAPTEQTGG
jgi:hypothetical protein